MIHGAVAAAALLALGVANAAGPAKSAPAGVSPAVKLMPAAVLYDQDDNSTDSGINSQNFEVDFDVYDNQGADDFTVPAGVKWSVTQVAVTGFYNTVGGAASQHVTFYKNKANLPQNVVADFPAVVGADTSGSFLITLPSKVNLKPGKYWVSVQANMDFLPAGIQWYWMNRSVQSGVGSAWKNPGDGFGTGCVAYTTLFTCIPTAGGPDLMFSLGGKSKPL